MERPKFEDAWKDAFDRAEASPSEDVWTNIELHLEKAKGRHLKRRLLFYQMLAAASVFFALTTGVYLLSNTYTRQETIRQSQDKKTTKHNYQHNDPIKPGESLAEKRKNSAHGEANRGKTFLQDNLNSRFKNKISAATLKKDKQNRTEDTKTSVLPPANEVVARRQNISSPLTTTSKGNLPLLVQIDNTTFLNIENVDRYPPAPDPVALMMASLENYEQQKGSEAKKRKDNDENLWTSVGFAAGSFSTVNSGTSAAFNTQNANGGALATVANKEAKASGTTYSMGIQVGTKLSPRWVLQGGVNYLAQSAAYTQEVLIVDQNFTQFRPANINDMKKLPEGDVKAENLVTTTPHKVNNDVRYLSVPMQAGYLIVNRDFAWQMNAGIAADLFLQNTVTATPTGGKVNQSKTDISEDSAFRPVNLSGLMGTEFSYKFGRHYRIALNPGVRYPFNSIYKSDDYKATRVTFDVGLKFRYIFH